MFKEVLRFFLDHTGALDFLLSCGSCLGANSTPVDVATDVAPTPTAGESAGVELCDEEGEGASRFFLSCLGTHCPMFERFHDDNNVPTVRVYLTSTCKCLFRHLAR